MNNASLQNASLPNLIEQITKWHHDRNLIKGTTDYRQFKKLLEEVIELYCAIMPGNHPEVLVTDIHHLVDELYKEGRIKTVCQWKAHAAKQDSIGDSLVVLTNIAERNKFTMASCAYQAYNEIKDRKGKMINGNFVKEEDLDENGNLKK